MPPPRTAARMQAVTGALTAAKVGQGHNVDQAVQLSHPAHMHTTHQAWPLHNCIAVHGPHHFELEHACFRTDKRGCNCGYRSRTHRAIILLQEFLFSWSPNRSTKKKLFFTEANQLKYALTSYRRKNNCFRLLPRDVYSRKPRGAEGLKAKHAV